MKITPLQLIAYEVTPPPSFRLDPIRVILHDLGPGQGRVSLEVWGRSWAAYWGGMGDLTIKDFFCSCGSDYLIEKLQSGRITKRDEDYLTRIIKAVQEALKTLPA
jgi:hypothetical protein